MAHGLLLLLGDGWRIWLNVVNHIPMDNVSTHDLVTLTRDVLLQLRRLDVRRPACSLHPLVSKFCVTIHENDVLYCCISVVVLSE